MLKDITLGQYFPGNTVMHRLDPRVKLTLTFVYIIILFAASGLAAYAVMLFWLILALALSKISPRVMFRGIRPIIFVIMLTAVFNIFYTPGNVIFSWLIFKITEEGLISAAFMVSRIIMLIMGTFLLTYTTSPIMLTDGIESLLSPLKRLKLPVHELAMMMSIALRFIPTLIEETDRIMSAQRARGADFDTGNIVRRAKALIPLIVPLFISAFRRADELAVAMECRCYQGGEGRTKLRQLKTGTVDYLASAVCAVLSALVILFRVYGI